MSAVRIAVFAKAPVPGRVKTRLAKELGDEGAARLHATLVARALSTAIESKAGVVELWCAPDVSHPFFGECAARFGVALRAQSGADLGERMRHAIDDALSRGKRALVTGSDCPALDARILREAAHALEDNDAVFVPAEDGGYVLVGARKAIPGIFEGIAWGGDSVMQATRERLIRARARWYELDPLWDVDRPEDYERMRREGMAPEAVR
jgi:rSAM/selenodomain-associated transferase 1